MNKSSYCATREYVNCEYPNCECDCHPISGRCKVNECTACRKPNCTHGCHVPIPLNANTGVVWKNWSFDPITKTAQEIRRMDEKIKRQEAKEQTWEATRMAELSKVRGNPLCVPQSFLTPSMLSQTLSRPSDNSCQPLGKPGKLAKAKVLKRKTQRKKN